MRILAANTDERLVTRNKLRNITAIKNNINSSVTKQSKKSNKVVKRPRMFMKPHKPSPEFKYPHCPHQDKIIHNEVYSLVEHTLGRTVNMQVNFLAHDQDCITVIHIKTFVESLKQTERMLHYINYLYHQNIDRWYALVARCPTLRKYPECYKNYDECVKGIPMKLHDRVSNRQGKQSDDILERVPDRNKESRREYLKRLAKLVRERVMDKRFCTKPDMSGTLDQISMEVKVKYSSTISSKTRPDYMTTEHPTQFEEGKSIIPVMGYPLAIHSEQKISKINFIYMYIYVIDNHKPP
jgi:hypothetical protein